MEFIVFQLLQIEILYCGIKLQVQELKLILLMEKYEIELLYCYYHPILFDYCHPTNALQAVLDVQLPPQDNTRFVSCSADRQVFVWGTI